MADNYGETIGRAAAHRIAASPANQTALGAIPADSRYDGQFAVVEADQSAWQFVLASSAAAVTGLVIVPADNPSTGRWLAMSPTALAGVGVPASPTAGQGLLATSGTSAVWTTQGPHRRTARNLIVTNVTDLTQYTVASGSQNDNVSGGNAANDRVLLVAQSTGTENGLYKVGTVAGGKAPLTRVADMPAGMVGNQGSEVLIQESGSDFANTVWFSTKTGGWTVGTDDPAFYPRRYMRTTTAMSGTPGTKALSAEWILSASETSVIPVAKTPGGTQGFLSIGTKAVGAGTGSVTVTSTANETSTLEVTILN